MLGVTAELFCAHTSRKKGKWLQLPRPARAATRRMHNQFGHKLKGPLIEILKMAKCPKEYIDAAKYLRCPDCEKKLKLPKQTSKVGLPPPYVFNHTLGLDVNYLPDADGTTFMFLNMVCMGTGFQIDVLLRDGHGTPT